MYEQSRIIDQDVSLSDGCLNVVKQTSRKGCLRQVIAYRVHMGILLIIQASTLQIVQCPDIPGNRNDMMGRIFCKFPYKCMANTTACTGHNNIHRVWIRRGYSKISFVKFR